MKDSQWAWHISVTINSVPLAARSSSEEAQLYQTGKTIILERMMLDCSHFLVLRAISRPHACLCVFLFACRECRNHWTYKVCKVCRTQKFCPFNLQILFLSLLPLALCELPVLLRGERRCKCLSSQSLIRRENREERSLQWKGEIEDWNLQRFRPALKLGKYFRYP